MILGVNMRDPCIEYVEYLILFFMAAKCGDFGLRFCASLSRLSLWKLFQVNFEIHSVLSASFPEKCIQGDNHQNQWILKYF